MRRSLLLCCCLALAPRAHAQAALDPFATSAAGTLVTPGITPGVAFLFDLEAKFARATAQGGGPAFAGWFADDAVTLSNGKAPVQGHAAIAASATWSPKSYQLTWTPSGGAMAPAGDMGYTWGHYEGRATLPDGQHTTTTGRYMTVWRKQPTGEWKVILDSSNDEPAGVGECCKLP
jgi:ketosteroid isomerase-like protein